MMRFDILGPIRVSRDDVDVDLGPPQQRALLALLLAEAGEPVSTTTIIDMLWDDAPPPTATNLIHRYVGALRRTLEPGRPARANGALLQRQTGGYRIVVTPDTLDLARFRLLRQQAARHVEAGDTAAAIEAYVAALRLWRGPCAADVRNVERVPLAFTAADHEYLAAAQDAARLALRSGLAHECLDDVRRAAARDPLNESIQACLIRLLAATGRRAEALAAYEHVRRRLADELGIDPGPDLRGAQRDVLQETPAASPAASPGTGLGSGPGHGPRHGPTPGTNSGIADSDADSDSDAGRTGGDGAGGDGTGGDGTGGDGTGGDGSDHGGAGQGYRVDQASRAGPDGTARSEGPAQASIPAWVRPVARPAQLPADLPFFVGRRAELDEAALLLTAPERTGDRTMIIAIDGMPGIGKTTLAVHLAHRFAGHFPDGQLYVNLRGFDLDGQVLDPVGALAGFLQALGVPAKDLPAELDERAALYRSVLTQRRVLVVLDNARDAAQVRPLLPGSATCLAIVTSRDRLTGLAVTHGARPLRLPLFDAEHAREYLIRRSGRGTSAVPAEVLDEITERCGRLPLALAVVAARAAYDADVPLEAIAEDLREAQGSLDAFAGADPATNARTVFSWSHRALDSDCARLFRLMALHPGPDITVHAAASLLSAPVRQTKGLLARLTDAHLLSEETPGQYTCHDLLRAYADEISTERDTPQARDQALHRLLDHYLHTAAVAVRRYSVHRPPIVLPDPLPGVSIPELATAEAATAWFDARHGILLELVDRTAASGRYDVHVWQLTWALQLFLHGRGLWHDLLALNQTAMAAATRLGDPVARGHTHAGLGRALANLRQLDAASDHMQRALELFEKVADPETRAEQHRTFSWVLEQQGRYDAALAQAEQALNLLQGTGHQARWAIARNAVGWYQALLGRYEEALDSCRRALEALEEQGEHRSQADVWDSIGFVHQKQGQYGAAVDAYERALTIWQVAGIRYAESTTLVRLGEACQAAGDHARAESAWRRALTLLIELDHPDSDGVRARLNELLGEM